MERIHPSIEQLEKVRGQVISGYFGVNREGLNWEGINLFFAEFGMHTKPIIVLSQAQWGLLPEIIVDAGIRPDLYRLTRDHGIYVHELELAFVERDETLEKLNGVIITEGRIVHEGAHSFEDYPAKNYYLYPDGISTNRSGFIVNVANTVLSRGSFLEEGFADYFTARYIERVVKADPQAPFAKLFQKAWQPPTNGWVKVVISSGQEVLMPIYYSYIDAPNSLRTLTSAFAGYALEILIIKRPELFNILIDARKSTQGLKNLALFFRQDPYPSSFYSFLQVSEFDEQSFFERLLKVMELAEQLV